jgi:Flp pilus assembly protein TadD
MILRNSIPKIILISILFGLSLYHPLLGYGQQTVVRGSVTDQDGNPIKDAKITFIDPSRGLKFSVKSKNNGDFIKVGIPPTVYQIKVECEGYYPFESQLRIRFGVQEVVTIKLEKIPPKVEEDKNFTEGLDFFKKGQYAEAIESFKKAIEKNPDSVEIYYNLGLSYLRNGDIDEAILSFEKAIELKPDSVVVHLAQGECYFNKGEDEKAMNSFSRALEIQPNDPRTYYNIGIVYYKNDDPERASAYFEQAIAIDPKFSSAYYQAGLASIKKGDFKKAVKFFEDFLKIEPDAPEAASVESLIQELKKQIK